MLRSWGWICGETAESITSPLWCLCNSGDARLQALHPGPSSCFSSGCRCASLPSPCPDPHTGTGAGLSALPQKAPPSSPLTPALCGAQAAWTLARGLTPGPLLTRKGMCELSVPCHPVLYTQETASLLKKEPGIRTQKCYRDSSCLGTWCGAR